MICQAAYVGIWHKADVANAVKNARFPGNRRHLGFAQRVSQLVPAGMLAALEVFL